MLCLSVIVINILVSFESWESPLVQEVAFQVDEDILQKINSIKVNKLDKWKLNII